MNGTERQPPSKHRLELVPASLAEAIREATQDEDLDRLYDLIDGVAEHDAEVAEYMRRLVSDVAFDALEELFEVHGR